MDVGVFLTERVEFIRQLYTLSSMPHIERKRLIDAGEPPFEPPYSEDGEPPFLVEWLTADDSIQVLGYACISMLSGTLQVFFKTWQDLFDWTDEVTAKQVAKDSKKRGFVSGYRKLFEDRLSISFDDSGVDFQFLEQVVLARNRIEHQEHLTMLRPSYSEADLKRIRSPFFMDEHEAAMFAKDDTNGDRTWMSAPRVSVTADQLMKALDEVIRLSKWMDTTLQGVRYRRPK